MDYIQKLSRHAMDKEVKIIDGYDIRRVYRDHFFMPKSESDIMHKITSKKIEN